MINLMAAGRLRLPCRIASARKSMHKNLATVEGTKTRFLCSITADEGANTTLAGYVKVGGERLPMVIIGENELVAPATPAGDYLYELRAGGTVVLWGQLCARASAFPPEGEYRDIEVSAEMAAESVIGVQAELRSGPRGEKGERGEEGPRGYSAYEIACQEGFEGTEAEWLEAMRQETSTLAVQQVTPLTKRAESAATEAANSETAAGENAEEAASSAAAAQGYALAAEKSAKVAAEAAGNADAARAGAQDAQSDAEMAAKSAAVDAKKAKADAAAVAEAREAAEASASEAQTAAREASTAAGIAVARQEAAEQSASEAAASAALLGDAALQSGDNTFTGNNVFSGETWGVLPIDFYKFSWCKTYADMKIICPTWAGLKNVCVDLSNLDEPEYYGVMDEGADILENVMFYFSGDIKRIGTLNGRQPSTAKNPLKSFTVYAPNATKCGRFRLPPNVEEIKIITPNTIFHTSCFDWAVNLKRIYFITKNTRLAKTKAGMFGLGWAYEYVQEIHAPLNILTSVELPDFFALHTIGYGFPSATIINLQKASLNKASVMVILNNLLTYDATTMETAPELTLGIDPTLDGDEEINEALLLAQTAVEDGGKGWNVAVSGFTITAGGGATMALRKPIFAKRRQDADGSYIDAEGVRYSIRYGNTVLENWVANEQLGYEEFGTIEDALNEWGLEEYEAGEREE